MKLLLLNGPNLNLLGVREPGIYGAQTYGALVALFQDACRARGVGCACFQSNHEGALVDKIQEAQGVYDGIVINPAAYTHTSVAILDALKAVALPAVEVHISDIQSREEFRRHSYVSPACIATIAGHGFQGYVEAVDLLIEHLTKLVTSLETKGAADILKYANAPGVIPLSAGSPSQEAFPSAELGALAARTFQEEPVTALQYNATDGYGPLREYLPGWLKQKYGIGGDGDRLLLTAGAQQAMWLAALCLCEEGDVVLCEDPSFVGSLNAFRGSRARLVGVPMEDDGLDVAALERAMEENERVKLLYTIPNFQNPTGITMSLEKRRQVYALAKAHGVRIVEDNPYGDLRYSGQDLPPIKALDDQGLVLYAGSFSKVIAPGLRVGYALGDGALLAAMSQVKLCDDVHTSALAQMLCHRYLTQTDFEGHLEFLRALYAKKCGFAKSCFQKHLAPYGITCAPAEGGLFLWLTLPASVDMRAFCTAAVRDYRVGVVPGSTFTVDPNGESHGFRVNFSSPSEEAIEEGFARLEQCAKAFLR